MAGGCPDCRLANVKVFDDSQPNPQTTIANLTQGISDSVHSVGANIINCSYEISGNDSGYQAAIQDAANNNVLVVAAAGNDGSNSPVYPSAYSNTVSVGAIDSSGNKPSWSNYGSWVDVTTQGVGIYAERGDGTGFDTADGTSFSTPITTAVEAENWYHAGQNRYNDKQNLFLSVNTSLPGVGTNEVYGMVNGRCLVQSIPTSNCN